MPSDDPMWVAARFAWLYVTILGFALVMTGLFALVGVVPVFVLIPELALIACMVALARRMRGGAVWAARVAALIVALCGVSMVLGVVRLGATNPLMLIHAILPIGITIAFVRMFLLAKPRAALTPTEAP